MYPVFVKSNVPSVPSTDAFQHQRQNRDCWQACNRVRSSTNINEPCAGLHDLTPLYPLVCVCRLYILDLLCCCMSCRWAASFQFSNTTPLCVTLKFTKYNGASSAALVMPIALIWLVCEKLACRSLLLRLWMSAELAQTLQLLWHPLALASFGSKVVEPKDARNCCYSILVSALVCIFCGVTCRNRSCCLPRPRSLLLVCRCASYCDWLKLTFIIALSSSAFGKRLADTLHQVAVAQLLMHRKVCSVLTCRIMLRVVVHMWRLTYTKDLRVCICLEQHWTTCIIQTQHFPSYCLLTDMSPKDRKFNLIDWLIQLDWIAMHCHMAVHLPHEKPVCGAHNYDNKYCCCVTIENEVEPAVLHHYICSSVHPLFKKLDWANPLLMQLPLLIPHCKAADCHLKHINIQLLDLQCLCRCL